MFWRLRRRTDRGAECTVVDVLDQVINFSANVLIRACNILQHQVQPVSMGCSSIDSLVL